MRLADKVALITGGTSGMGRATAVLFAQEGARVAITGRNEARGRAVDEAWRAFGRLDILFNNAGVFYPNTVLTSTEEEWDLTLDINLKGIYLMCKYALPIMIAQGSGVIINNASNWGLVGGPKAAAYCASKGGVVLLTKAMALDHAGQGIRINCICPGDVLTPMLTEEARRLGVAWEAYLAAAANCPMGRVGRPEEIAKAVLFLASDDSSFITGAALVADGGFTAE